MGTDTPQDDEPVEDRPQPGQSDKIRALHEAATDIVGCDTEAEVYRETVAAAEGILEFDLCCTMIYDDEMLLPKAVSSGAPPDGARPMEPDQGEAGHVFQTGEPKITQDTLEDEVSDPAKNTYRSGMSVPMGDVGVFQAVATEPEAFAQPQLELAELLVAYTDAAIDRIRYDEALEDENQRFRSLFELSTDCISESTLSGDQAIVRQVNPAFEELFGYDAEEVVGEPLDDFVTPESKRSEGHELNQRSAEGEGFEREVTRKTADGTREFILRSIPFELGDELRCFAVYTDITERKRDRRRFRALTEHSSDVIAVLESDGTIAYHSPSSEHVLGYEPESLVGQNAFEFIHPEDRQEMMTVFQEAVTEGTDQPAVEYRFRHADGSWRYLESIGTNRLDDPAVEGFVVNSRDVTERKQRLEILAELPVAAQKLRAVAQESTVAEITVETVREVLNLPIAGVWLHDDADEALRPAAQTPEAGTLFGDLPTFTPDAESLSWRAFEDGEYRVFDDLRHEDATHNPETTVRSEMILPLGRYGVINIGSTERQYFSDVDVYFSRILAAMAESALERLHHEGELQTQRAELERQNEQLDAFASTVTHDLRNPLNVAVGYADMAAKADTMEEATSFADRVVDSLTRLGTIIEDVLELAREGRSVDDLEHIDLESVARDAWENVATDDARLEVADSPTILADESRVVQLLENHYRNAREHGDADTVRVETLHQDGEVTGFAVEDDGIGMSDDVRASAFELSFTTADDGTGFGLNIVEEIAEGHGWSVSVTEGPDGGARFEFDGVESLTD